MRKVVQYLMDVKGSSDCESGSIESDLMAFCDDGTAWILGDEYEKYIDGHGNKLTRPTGSLVWRLYELPPIPQEREE